MHTSLVTVDLEDAVGADADRLLGEADAHSSALYRDEHRHPVDAAFLARPEVRFFVARRAGEAVGCAALVVAATGAGELKRMVVLPDARRLGVGKLLLDAVEAAAKREGLSSIRLETGPRNVEALNLYRSRGYRDRGPFADYRSVPDSVFLERPLTPPPSPAPPVGPPPAAAPPPPCSPA